MKAGIQTFFGEAGEAACYALDLINVAEEFLQGEVDPCSALLGGIDRKFIHYSWNDAEDNDNFYVSKPAEFLEYLTGRKWKVVKTIPDYEPKPGEYVIQRWERTKTGAIIGHFRRPNWDSLVSSATVRLGTIVSLRICSPTE
jgi:hypothetical protein